MKDSKKITIVVVEDEKLIAKSIVNNIEKVKDDFAVIGVAYNGEDGFELVSTLLPNILFTDIKMPIMDGLQLISKVKENFPFIKIVVVSGYDDFEYARAAIQNNVTDYLLKPINLTELNNSLRKIRNEIIASTCSLQSSGELRSPAEIVEVVKEYIHVNYAKQLDLAEIAENLGFSSAYLTKVFRKQLQTPPSKYLNEYRMTIAKHLLRDSALPVKTISEQVGFLDPFHFSKRFKEYCGFSPAQYRMQK